jgi:hypothetical protein
MVRDQGRAGEVRDYDGSLLFRWVGARAIVGLALVAMPIQSVFILESAVETTDFTDEHGLSIQYKFLVLHLVGDWI